MSKVFANIAQSLDGYMAPDGMTIENWSNPGFKDSGAKWGALMSWLFHQRYFRENLKLGEGGDTGPINDMLRATANRTGANIMGKRMFDAGEISWPENAPFHTPVFVLTHQQRDPWPRPGGTTFHFVNDGLASALEQARRAADGRDIRISGGADVIQQGLRAGVIDEIAITFSPVLFGAGRRLFENLGEPLSQFKIAEVLNEASIVHVRYQREAK